MMTFVPGLELNRLFYNQVIKDLMVKHFPDLTYSAALIGFGSDVMGYATSISMDHMWGPRLLIFLKEGDEEVFGRSVQDMFSNHLPLTFKGFSTNYSDPDKEGISVMEMTDQRPVRHLIRVTTVKAFVGSTLDCDDTESLSLAQWLGILDQSLIELTAGEVYHDGLGTLKPISESLSFFPMEVARVRLAALWMALGQEVAFVGRNRDLEDYLSVKMISTRIVNTLMKMCFYMEKRYIPYSKWFGHGFKELAAYGSMAPLFEAVLMSNDMLEIENRLADAYVEILNRLNQTDYLKVTVDVAVTDYFNRPYKVMFADQIIEGLMADVPEPLKSVKLDDVAALLTANGIDLGNLGGWIRRQGS